MILTRFCNDDITIYSCKTILVAADLPMCSLVTGRTVSRAMRLQGICCHVIIGIVFRIAQIALQEGLDVDLQAGTRVENGVVLEDGRVENSEGSNEKVS